MVFCKNQTVKNYDLWVDLFKSFPTLCISASSPRPFLRLKQRVGQLQRNKERRWVVVNLHMSRDQSWPIHSTACTQHLHLWMLSYEALPVSVFNASQVVPDCQAPIPIPPCVPCTNSSPGSWHHAISQPKPFNGHHETWRCHVEFQRQLCTSNKVMVLPVGMS